MSSTAANLCCSHPRQQLDSPQPPSRPMTTIDGIFAAAALPEDHPHALQVPHRKPEVDPSIIRSPGFASKIKLQFQRRRSKMSLGAEKGYHGDAREMTMQEALDDSEYPQTKKLEYCQQSGDVRFSVVNSIGHVKPRNQHREDVNEDVEVNGIVELAKTVASSPQWVDGEICDRGRPSSLPKSASLPLLSKSDEIASPSLRHFRSMTGVGDSLDQESLTVGMPFQETTHSTAASEGVPAVSPVPLQPVIPTFHIREATSDDILTPMLDQLPTEPKPKPMSSEDSLHLHRMEISQQLRSLSQLSDVVEDGLHIGSAGPWAFHRRERSDISSIAQTSRRPRHVSSSGMDSITVPPAWGRVRSAMPDAASSIYSRPTSAGGSGTHHATPDQELPVPAVDLHALFSDWPLKTSGSIARTSRESRNDLEGSERLEKPLPPTPSDSRKGSGTTSFVTAANDAEPDFIRRLSPPLQTSTSFIGDGASVITKSSKHSKFLERLSPPKKTVKKRRSIFKFLRPGSRKQEGRSISTPTLTGCTTKVQLSFDGQSEDPALLTVQYELDERPGQSRRVTSMKNLLTAPDVAAPIQSLSAPGLQRRPTLADYERILSVAGDDRRRPSTINIARAKEVQEDDHRESITGIRRRLSRARPLKDDASPLMAQALEKHQQEKALFRSASKQRESLKGSVRTAPVFASSPFSSLGLVPDDTSELVLNPLEKGKPSTAIQRSRSSTYLLPPGPPHSASSPSQTAFLKSYTGQSAAPQSPVPKKRIGTSLESWSRYPSHTRAERCGSAGRPDNVITRDFAVDINHADIQETDDTEVTSSASRKAPKSKRARNVLIKSRSMNFSSIVRYYSNLFSSSSVGQNRRTSITIGGRLEYPELELLPDQLAAEPLAQSSHKHRGALHRLKDHAKEDADKIKEFVKEEEEKVEEYVKEEEDKFETVVRRGEDEFKGFVKKEEVKLKEFVRTEEDKMKHHWRHHRSNDHSHESPFRDISLFEIPRDHGGDNRTRKDSMSIGPNDEAEEEPPAPSHDSASAVELRLDGATISSTLDGRKLSSKAELWSEVYRECLPKPSSLIEEESKEQATSRVLMPPSQLRPTKARSPEQSGSTATIRRFPSVTVIDDRKGHFRSISLISVKTGSSAGHHQTSTRELLDLVQAREKREREKTVKCREGQEMYATSGAQ